MPVGAIIAGVIGATTAVVGAVGASQSAKGAEEAEAERLAAEEAENEKNSKLKQRQLNLSGIDRLAEQRQSAQGLGRQKSFKNDMQTALQNVSGAKRGAPQAPQAPAMPQAPQMPKPAPMPPPPGMRPAPSQGLPTTTMGGR